MARKSHRLYEKYCGNGYRLLLDYVGNEVAYIISMFVVCLYYNQE